MMVTMQADKQPKALVGNTNLVSKVKVVEVVAGVFNGSKAHCYVLGFRLVVSSAACVHVI